MNKAVIVIDESNKTQHTYQRHWKRFSFQIKETNDRPCQCKMYETNEGRKKEILTSRTKNKKTKQEIYVQKFKFVFFFHSLSRLSFSFADFFFAHSLTMPTASYLQAKWSYIIYLPTILPTLSICAFDKYVTLILFNECELPFCS